MSSATKPVGVALLGAGNFAKGAHLPAIAASSSTLLLKAVYSRSATSAASLAAAAKCYPSTSHHIDAYSEDRGLAALLARDDIDVVVLSLPILVQPAMIEKAWKAGKSVISEKPIAENLDEAKRLISLYETEYQPKGMQWIVAEQFPYEEAFCIAKDVLASDKIGELKSFTLDYNNYIAPGNKTHETAWRKDCRFAGGFVLDGGVHFLAGLRFMLPSPLSSLSAQTTLVAPHLHPCDLLHAITTTSSGQHGSVRISWGIPSSMKRVYTFYGTLGRLDVDFTPNETNTFSVTTVPLVGPPVVANAIAQAVVKEFEYFGRALQAGPDSVDAQDVRTRSGPRATLKDLAFIQGALESAGSQVDLLALLGDFSQAN